MFNVLFVIQTGVLRGKLSVVYMTKTLNGYIHNGSQRGEGMQRLHQLKDEKDIEPYEMSLLKGQVSLYNVCPLYEVSGGY